MDRKGNLRGLPFCVKGSRQSKTSCLFFTIHVSSFFLFSIIVGIPGCLMKGKEMGGLDPIWLYRVINQSINQSFNQSVHQSINHHPHDSYTVPRATINALVITYYYYLLGQASSYSCSSPLRYLLLGTQVKAIGPTALNSTYLLHVTFISHRPR